MHKMHTWSAKNSWKKAWPAKHDNNSSGVSCGGLLTSDKECPETSGDKWSRRNEGNDGAFNCCGLPDSTDGSDGLLEGWIDGDSFPSAPVKDTSPSNDAALFCKQNTTTRPSITLAILCNHLGRISLSPVNYVGKWQHTWQSVSSSNKECLLPWLS